MSEPVQRRTTYRPAKLYQEPEAVTYAREQAGLTQVQVADYLGVKPSVVCMWESGQRSVPPVRLIKLAELFNCPRVVLERKRFLLVTDPVPDEKVA